MSLNRRDTSSCFDFSAVTNRSLVFFDDEFNSPTKMSKMGGFAGSDGDHEGCDIIAVF